MLRKQKNNITYSSNNPLFNCYNNMKQNKTNTELKVITLTQGEIQDAMKHRVHKSKKDYKRHDKHKGRDFSD